VAKYRPTERQVTARLSLPEYARANTKRVSLRFPSMAEFVREAVLYYSGLSASARRQANARRIQRKQKQEEASGAAHGLKLVSLDGREIDPSETEERGGELATK
jgi:Arc/MetJ-type ribon-helix-helix transcriptional regulator